jgi:DNA-binding response OmpR family regulator
MQLDGSSTSDTQSNGSISLGRLHVDRRSRTVSIDGNAVYLTSGEFDLLWCLASRAGNVITRDELFKQLLSIEYNGLDRTIDVRVSRLRRKLGDDSDRPHLIKAIRGDGYLLAVV